MAARKRARRSSKRVNKRKAGSKSGMLALAVLLGLGGFSIWASSQHKNPTDAIAKLFQPSATSSKVAKPSSPVRADMAPPKRTAHKTQPQPNKRDTARAIGPAPRPSVALVPASRPLQPQKPASLPSKPVSAPVGLNTPAHSPTVVYARERLTIRKTAWNKSPAIGTVEKGREMRSYEKTGRWHRIAVPTTNLIGWVHEDQLIGGNKKPDRAAVITGSINSKSQPAQIKRSNPAQKPRPQPPLALGSQN